MVALTVMVLALIIFHTVKWRKEMFVDTKKKKKLTII
jgi:heme exporter protein D